MKKHKKSKPRNTCPEVKIDLRNLETYGQLKRGQQYSCPNCQQEVKHPHKCY